MPAHRAGLVGLSPPALPGSSSSSSSSGSSGSSSSSSSGSSTAAGLEPADIWPVSDRTRSPRIVSAITVDGGTRLRSTVQGSPDAPAWTWAREVLARLHLDAPAALAALARGDLDPLLPVLGRPTVSSGGSMGRMIRLQWDGIAWVELDTLDRLVRVQAKAPWLWAHGGGARGWSSWLRGPLAELERWLFSDVSEQPAERWTVTGVELCVDAIGVSFGDDDRAAWVGARKASALGPARGAVETLAVGTRASPISVCVYDKDRQIIAERRPDLYAAHHAAHGWRGEVRWRAEIRLSGVGLQWSTADGEILDLRDPAELERPSQLALAWQLAAAKRRLVVADGATRTRRAATDPRWRLYQSAGAELEQRLDDAAAWRQRRTVSAEIHARRLQRARDDLRRAALRLLALEGCERSPELATLDGALELAAQLAARPLDFDGERDRDLERDPRGAVVAVRERYALIDAQIDERALMRSTDPPRSQGPRSRAGPAPPEPGAHSRSRGTPRSGAG